MKAIFLIFFFVLFSGAYCQEITKDSIVKSTDWAVQIDTTLNEKQKNMPPWYVRRFKIGIGGFLPTNNTAVEVRRREDNEGVEIDFEDDLGYNRSITTILGIMQWRVARRSKIEFEYYKIDRETSRKLDKTIEFGDHVYDINTVIRSYFNTNIYKLMYGYSILLNPKYELGLMIGAHVLAVETGISSTGQEIYRDDFEFTAPLPDLGIWGGYAFNEKWAFTGNFSYLGAKVDNVKGNIVTYNFQVAYQVIPNLELGAGFTGVNFEVNVTKPRFEGDIRWGYSGPSLTIAYSFGKKAWK